ncbi:MAG: DUF1788 domain-containing protein [Desulfobacteraceae bacterium]|nr:DUF1788 domain-containing protein [Desulfobacteraceae bacterium]
MDLHTFRQRLDKILPRLISDELLSNTGLGNEIGFYIFDYPPEYELEMREHIGFLLAQIPKKRPDIRVAHVNLFHLLVDYLKDRKLLDRLIAEQRKNGPNRKLLSELKKGPLNPERVAREFVNRAEPASQDLVMVSGVGNAYPMIRSHSLLNNLHAPMGDTPLVMFYPGIYTGQGLRLFGKLSSSNYYRAFRLVL